MRIYPFKALHPKLDLISSIDSFFGSVKQDYRDYFQSGFFQKQRQEALYIYEIRGESRTYRGLIGCLDITEYTRGHIKKHEQTLAYKMQKQVALALQRRAAVKPVLLTYPRQENIESWVDRYLEKATGPFFTLSFQAEQTVHSFWQINDSRQISEIQGLFDQALEVAYIADGHHRSAAQAFMFERGIERSVNTHINRLLCAFFPPDQLEIHDFNRVVQLGADFSPSLFMARLSRVCHIEILPAARKPRHKHELVMGYGEEWYGLQWKEQVLNMPGQQILPDTQLLNEWVLEKILGIEDVRTDKRIDYVEGPKGLDSLLKKANDDPGLIFVLYPIQAEAFFQLVDLGIMLPPKSTWFEPRMKNGLLVHSFS